MPGALAATDRSAHAASDGTAVSDRTFEKRRDLIIANYHAVLALTVTVCGAVTLAAAVLPFPARSIPYRALLVAAATVMSGIKQHEAIVWLCLLGYGVSVAAALALRT